MSYTISNILIDNSVKGNLCFDPTKYHRRSIRLKTYDYSQGGAYFVTICTKDRSWLLGQIDQDKITLNQKAVIVQKYWNGIPNHYVNVDIDAFVVMPNHIHGIIVFNSNAGAIHESNMDMINQSDMGSVNQYNMGSVNQYNMGSVNESHVGAIHESPKLSRRRMTLSIIIGRLKMNTAKEINLFQNTPGVPVWQRNYYEHVIRNEKSLDQIREYISNNPRRWNEDNLMK